MLRKIKLPIFISGALFVVLVFIFSALVLRAESHRPLLYALFTVFLILLAYTLSRNHAYIFLQRKTHRKIRAMSELSGTMITSLDEETIIRSTLETAKKILDFEFCDFLLIDRKTDELVVKDSIGEMATPKGYRVPISENRGISVAVAISGKAIHLPDVSKDSRYIQIRFKEGSELCVPIIIKGNVIGVINAEKEALNAFSEVDELLFSELAAHAAIALENAQLNRAIVDSEKKYRTVVDNINVGVLLISPAMEILFLNNQMKKWFPHIDVAERPFCYSVFNPSRRNEVCSYCPTKETFRDGSIHKSIAETAVGGRLINYGVTSFPVRDECGNIAAAIELVEDITMQRQHERMILHAKEEWENTFDSVPDLIVTVDSDYRIMRLNRAMAARLGIEPREAVGRSCFKLIHGTQKPPDFCILSKSRGLRKSRNTEFHLSALDGDFLVTLSPLMQEDGRMTGAIHVFRDITERKKMEEALIESEEKYRATVEQSLTGVYIVQDGVFKFVNKRFCELAGFSYGEIINKLSPADLTHPDDRMTVRKHMTELLSGQQKSAEFEMRALRKDGNTFPIRVLGSTAAFRGKPAIIGTFLDLSQEKALEMQLIRAQKMESLGQLAGGIAHDFNNVLGIIMGSLDLFETSELAERSRRLNEIALKAAERGSEIVKRLLLFARTEEPSLVPVALPDIINETIGILEHTLGKNIKIMKSANPRGDIILGNKEQLIQMLLNICTNAQDAMPDGGTLSISLDRKDSNYINSYFREAADRNYCALRITDTGTGMDDQTMEKIFDPFFTTKERGKGTGLGLAIVHSIVKNHKGLIDVESAPGAGTTFSIYFPIESGQSEAKAEAQEELTTQGGPETILIVDDEETLRDVLKELLAPLGYTIMEAADGAEAIARCGAYGQSIDLVILDMGLPGISGETVLTTLREMDQHPNVIVASGFMNAAQRSALERLGVKNFIQKPYTLQEVARTVRRTLNESSPKIH